MVVRFFPSDDERDSGGARRRGDARVGRRPAAGEAAIAYLPGASPSERAQAAVAAVRSVAKADAEAERAEGREPQGKTAEKAERRAANVSLHQLARRGMSRWELEQVLRKREVDEVAAAAELDRLESVGLLDDEALAVSLVYAARARKGQGRQAIEQELRRRHIDDDTIENALADYDQEEELARAVELALKRVAQLREVDDQTAERRLFGYLLRRGYPSSTVGAAVSEAMRSRR